MKSLFKNKLVTINIVVLLLVAALFFTGAAREVYEVGILKVRTIQPLHPSTTIALTGSERARMIDLTSVFFTGANSGSYAKPDKDGLTAPGFATPDTVFALVYANSTETASIAYNFRVPYDYSGGLGFRMLLSSDQASPVTVGWDLRVNTDDTGFASTIITQESVACAGTYINVSNEVATLSTNATGRAAISTGKWVQVAFWNATTANSQTGNAKTTGNNTLEIKGIELYYTPRQ